MSVSEQAARLYGLRHPRDARGWHLEPLRELLALLDTVTLSTISPTTAPAVQVLAPRTDTPTVREAVT